jgi:DNA repair photolyase
MSPAAPALFPVVSPTGAPLAERNDVEYVRMTCKSILNWVQGTHMKDVFSVNPYRGCEFGCSYCYARYTFEFMELDAATLWDRRIFVKTDAPAALRRDLRRREVLKYGIAIGTATDPYQPAERKFEITRRILEGLLPLRGIPLSIVTKSGLVRRDADLLAELSRRHEVDVCFSCISLDDRLLRALEPRAPHPLTRFEAMRALTDRGVRCGLLIAPVLPGLTDGETSLRDVIARARGAGASFVHASVLWLSDTARRVFLPWLQSHHPELYARYAATYGSRMYEDRRYRDAVQARVRRLARAHGFA